MLDSLLMDTVLVLVCPPPQVPMCPPEAEPCTLWGCQQDSLVGAYSRRLEGVMGETGKA